jgi:predicted cupin superfamily sugar epimerase
MTCIYFLLTSENPSQFHSIKGDEIWFHHEGNDLSVHYLHKKEYKVLKLGRTSLDSLPQQRVNGDMIFGSTVDEPNGYALVSCVVSPGFDFQDFRLYTKKELLAKYEQFSEIIMKLGH